MTCYQEARQRLQNAGLKVSMGRLKIIEMLLQCDERMSCQGIHRLLVESGAPLSLFSVRQTLRRLEQGGLVVNEAGNFYRLAEPVVQRYAQSLIQGERLMVSA